MSALNILKTVGGILEVALIVTFVFECGKEAGRREYALPESSTFDEIANNMNSINTTFTRFTTF